LRVDYNFIVCFTQTKANVVLEETKAQKRQETDIVQPKLEDESDTLDIENDTAITDSISNSDNNVSIIFVLFYVNYRLLEYVKYR